MKTHSILLPSILTLSIILSGCRSEISETESHSPHAENGELQQESSSATTLPSFLFKKEKAIQIIYKKSAQHQRLLENIPCYCGCDESVGHLNNYDCFIFENKKNDHMVWDDHGTRCGVCLQIATDSIAMENEGISIKEIRQAIDEKYADGFANPTPVPKG